MIRLVIGLPLLLLFFRCTKDRATLDYGGFPKEVGEIFSHKCSTTGCHNSKSAPASAGLDLSSWETLFRGTKNNSSVIPYRPDHSFLFFSVNTYHHLGPQLSPSMPLNREPLEMDEVMAIKDWISNGAKNNQDEVNFSDHGPRSKIYIGNQGCDVVSVFDADTKQLIRVFDVGNEARIESPHDLVVSPDGKYIYVTFYVSNLFQKYSTYDHTKVSELAFFDSGWHAITISGDSRTAIATQLSASGRIKVIDLETMKEKVTFVVSNPHGCALNYDGTVAYVTSQQGNHLYKLNLADTQNYVITEVPLQTGAVPQLFAEHKPYAVSFFPGYSKYAVTCQGTNEVRIFNTSNDSLLKTIHLSGIPQLIAFSEKSPYLFVSCMSDISNSESASQVVVINATTLTEVKSIFTGFQPRGIAVDDKNNYVWVANRNISSTGWQPHHTTECHGNNGYITLIDIKTLQLVQGWNTEVSVDPYSTSIKK
jgi:DNA-binding beta-propeller fold protein YncE